MTKIAVILAALSSIAGLALYALKRWYGPPPESRAIYKLKCDLQETRYEIMREVQKIKKTHRAKRDYARYNRLLAKRKFLCEKLDIVESS